MIQLGEEPLIIEVTSYGRGFAAIKKDEKIERKNKRIHAAGFGKKTRGNTLNQKKKKWNPSNLMERG